MITNFLLSVISLLTEFKDVVVVFIDEDLRPIAHELREYIQKKKASLPDESLSIHPVEVSEEYDRYVVSEEGIVNGVWVPKKAAWTRLGICRDTLDRKLADNVLRVYHQKGDECKKKPRVFLLAEEVEQHYHEYSLKKGKG